MDEGESIICCILRSEVTWLPSSITTIGCSFISVVYSLTVYFHIAQYILLWAIPLNPSHPHHQCHSNGIRFSSGFICLSINGHRNKILWVRHWCRFFPTYSQTECWCHQMALVVDGIMVSGWTFLIYKTYKLWIPQMKAHVYG